MAASILRIISVLTLLSGLLLGANQFVAVASAEEEPSYYACCKSCDYKKMTCSGCKTNKMLCGSSEHKAACSSAPGESCYPIAGPQ